jgi:hypothetical protein
VIHVCSEGKVPEASWLARAAAAEAEIRAEVDAESRALVLTRRRAVWQSLRAWLMELSGGKCWYSEAIDRGAMSDVDHYRPKSRAVDTDGTVRGGYWWLAFDWRNLRFSAQLCNRPNRDPEGAARGKRDWFPLRTGTRAATGPDDDIAAEEPHILDPATKGDPKLLSFNEAGLAIPFDATGWGGERATTTIELLHLDAPRFVDGRKQVWQRCIRNVNRVMAHAHSGADDPDLRSALEELWDLVASTAEFAATARTCLLKTGHAWADELVAAAQPDCGCT